jgi:hypothetical protein
MANVKIRVLPEQKSSLKGDIFLYGTSTENTILTVDYTGSSCSLLTSAARIAVQMAEVSMLG